MRIERLGTLRCRVGEGPVWDVREQMLWFVDTIDCAIWRYDAACGAFMRWPVPSEIGSLALCETGGAIVSLRSGFHRFDFASGEAMPVADPRADRERTRLNDGKVDPRGRFLAGSIDERFTDPLGALYRLDADLTVSTLMGGVTISNGPCWSPDGGTFYFTDSAAKIVSAFDYDLETGTLSNRRVFADTSTYPGVPDGATVDAEGFYWMAICGAGMILRLGPDGAVVREIPIPTALTVSSVMFGGADLDRLFVTSIGESSLGLDTGSEGGGLFVIDGLGVRGLPEPRFAG